ncbi:MAG: asparaginase domain-containing protein, partial [Rikenellaceae bacterium]
MKKILFLVLMLTMSASIFAAGKLPNIHILATGGTIAGAGATSTGTTYKAGQVGIDVLVRAVPQLKQIANITEEQVVKIGSQDMTDEVWL